MKKCIESYLNLKKNSGILLEKSLKNFSIFLMLVYKSIGSVHFGGCCRFEPSCSDYSLACYQRFTFLRATQLTIERLLSCRPFGRRGYDPVPEQNGVLDESR